ncbi:MAG: hypothetical protein MHMPM18_003161, partial [Marteilia pararefringens]
SLGISSQQTSPSLGKSSKKCDFVSTTTQNPTNELIKKKNIIKPIKKVISVDDDYEVVGRFKGAVDPNYEIVSTAISSTKSVDPDYEIVNVSGSSKTNTSLKDQMCNLAIPECSVKPENDPEC